MAPLVFNFFVALTRELSNWKLEEKFYIYTRQVLFSIFKKFSIKGECIA